MSSPAPETVSARNVFRRFRRNRQGSAAVEFALIAPLFFGMLFAIIETAIVFFAGQVLEQGTAESARLMMTRQAQDSGMNETAFKRTYAIASRCCSTVTAIWATLPSM